MDTIGDLLRRKREAMGLNLQQIEDETNMRWKYLEALEQGNYHVIPGEAYVKGFLRNYAAFLELDSEEILRMYKEQHEKKPVENVPQEQPIKKEKSRKRPNNKQNNKPILFIGAALALLIVAGVIFANQGDEVEGPGQVEQKPTPQQNTGSDPQPSPNTNGNPSPSPAPKPEPKPDTDPPVAQAPEKNVLILKATNGRCWIRVEVDGTNVYEGHLNLGDSKEFSGKTLKVRYGNAGAIRVTLNGEDLGAPGPMGMPEDKEYGN